MKYNRLSELTVSARSFIRFDGLWQFKITHDFQTHFMVWILLEGSIRYSIENGGEHTLRAGELLICPPYYNINKIAEETVSVCFLTYIADSGAVRIPLGTPVYRVNDRIAEDIALIDSCASDDPYRKLLQMDIWHQLCRLYSEPTIPDNMPSDKRQMASVLEYIDASLEKKLTLDELAVYAGYSKSAFIRQFRDQVGLTPMQYIIDRRIDRVKRMLPGNCPLRQIAAECGFLNEFYLITVFKKYTGMTPGEYRREYGI